MQIFINKQLFEIEQPTTLAQLLASHGLDAPGMAVAVNNKLVPRDNRESFTLSDGDQLVVIKAVCGG